MLVKLPGQCKLIFQRFCDSVEIMCVTHSFTLFLTLCVQSTGNDKDAIVAILGARSNKQRQEIAAKYQQKYNKVNFKSDHSKRLIKQL